MKRTEVRGMRNLPRKGSAMVLRLEMEQMQTIEAQRHVGEEVRESEVGQGRTLGTPGNSTHHFL